MMQIILIYLFIMNAFGLYLMWSDKRKAKMNVWRTPERNFFLLSIIGGSVGCWIGMYLFRHKTQHIKFTVGIPAIILLQIAVILLLVAKGIELYKFL